MHVRQRGHHESAPDVHHLPGEPRGEIVHHTHHHPVVDQQDTGPG